MNEFELTKLELFEYCASNNIHIRSNMCGFLCYLEAELTNKSTGQPHWVHSKFRLYDDESETIENFKQFLQTVKAINEQINKKSVEETRQEDNFDSPSSNN